MNEAKVTDLDYINFLVASPCVFSCTDAARVQPEGPRRAAHDALTRLLTRLDPAPRRSGTRPSSTSAGTTAS